MAVSKLHDYLLEHENDLVAELSDWVRIPSVAGVPEQRIEVVRSARWLAGTLRAIGFPVVEVWSEDEAPAVYAEWCAEPSAPTVLIYSHHDVRVSKDEQWQETRPHEPVVRDGYLYGRGVSDAKGQVLTHLWSLRAHLAATGRTAPAVNVKLLIEGEEETGSPHFRQLLKDHRNRLAADLVVFSDTMLWQAGHPAVCTSIRGTINAHLEVYGPQRDVHGGAVSGPAPNPVLALAALLGGLYDDKGRVTVPGFYDAVIEPSERRRQELAELPFTEEDWLARSETGGITHEAGYTVLEQLWTRPAIEAISVIAGDPEGVPRAVVPAVATAELSIRTVPDQTVPAVAEQLRRWVADALPPEFGHELSITEETGQDPYQTPEDHPAVQVLAEAMEAGFGKPAGRMGNAGGGPVRWLEKVAGAPVVFFGTGLPEDRWHDSDERAAIEVLRKGAATLAHFWNRLAETKF
ncbi:M20/M25/M40 family metallo-hydrolase [Kribbella sp. CA-293567]|uniref:M20/M25/M40 family metallo-hydrolase n=1 Tax=Kribbella sp. CA-293567 TaxID=3002436 RepID=UPI0022DE94D7|nr:M20/M25/M40 family metallo-hydrolase [Kribbella sp. CA-293567]WBQ04490.1 M20/M25/M40 family metallo-hydrolase [Kribbella sp. CA-293567]